METRQLDYTYIYRKKRNDFTVRGRENDSEHERGEEIGETELNKTQHGNTLTRTDKNRGNRRNTKKVGREPKCVI